MDSSRCCVASHPSAGLCMDGAGGGLAPALFWPLLFLLTAFTLTLGLRANAAKESKFNFEKEGEFVCQVIPSTGERRDCLPLVREFPEALEIVEKVRALSEFVRSKKPTPTKSEREALGGAISLSAKTASQVLANYKRLSVRDFAVKPEGELSGDEQFIDYPAFVSIYWQGRAYMQGTLFAEGRLRVRRQMQPPPASADAFEFIISKFSDSPTEKNQNWLRFSEQSARYIHFAAIYGARVDTEQATSELLNQIVAPVILTEMFR